MCADKTDPELLQVFENNTTDNLSRGKLDFLIKTRCDDEYMQTGDITSLPEQHTF